MAFLPYLLLGVLPLLCAGASDQVSYDGFSVVRVNIPPHSETIVEQLQSLNVVDISGGQTAFSTFAIPRDELSILEDLNLNSTILVEDLGLELQKEGAIESFYKDKSIMRTRQASMPPFSWFSNYRPYTEHLRFLFDLGGAAPRNSEVLHVGYSYEGKDIYALHIWGNHGQGGWRRPAIMMHGGTHAREWISNFVTEGIAWYITSGIIENDSTVMSLLDKYDFWFIPIVNPDGFVYTQTTDRLWRKNRQPREGTSCIGTDNNRNWRTAWDVPGGASTDPCGETFKGLSPGDTPENFHIGEFSKRISNTLSGMKFFIDWHSYGQMLLLPYGYDCKARPPNYTRQLNLASTYSRMVAAPFKSKFTYGQSCAHLYKSTGNAPDYHDSLGAEFSWTIELRPTLQNAGPDSGFVLPPGEIAPSVFEQWVALRTVFSSM